MGQKKQLSNALQLDCCLTFLNRNESEKRKIKKEKKQLNQLFADLNEANKPILSAFLFIS